VIEEQARRDALTGLANRHAFDAAIIEHLQLALRTGRECSLVLLDIDRFKGINDKYGHLAGDEALRQVARVVREEVGGRLRDGDRPLMARYGGEEMAIILPSMGLGGAIRIAQAIRERVEQNSITHDGVSFQLTISGGVACAPLHARTVRQLITAADESLYRAKGGGRNRIEAPGSLMTAVINS
jgi:diguanylate cyclase (GGDEF)-like protein